MRQPTPKMLALTQAEAAVGDWRLNECDLFVTKEPCPMCAGALSTCACEGWSFGCPDPVGARRAAC
jgi:tRNA(adenine34) deaminase